jgi:hypothetical protein
MQLWLPSVESVPFSHFLVWSSCSRVLPPASLESQRKINNFRLFNHPSSSFRSKVVAKNVYFTLSSFPDNVDLWLRTLWTPWSQVVEFCAKYISLFHHMYHLETYKIEFSTENCVEMSRWTAKSAHVTFNRLFFPTKLHSDSDGRKHRVNVAWADFAVQPLISTQFSMENLIFYVSRWYMRWKSEIHFAQNSTTWDHGVHKGLSPLLSKLS